MDFTKPGLSEGRGYCSCRMLCRYLSEGDTVVAGRCVGMCQELQGNMEGYDEDGRLTEKGGDCLIEILAYALIACPYMCHAGHTASIMPFRMFHSIYVSWKDVWTNQTYINIRWAHCINWIQLVSKDMVSFLRNCQVPVNHGSSYCRRKELWCLCVPCS